MVNDLAAQALDASAIASRLRIVLARLHRRLRREAEKDYSAASISVLATLQREGELTLGELAQAEGVSRPSMTVLAAALERQGLMRREPDPKDGRLVRVNLTPEGDRALQRTRTRRNVFLAKKLSRLSSADLTTLGEAARILEQVLEEKA